MLIHPKPASSVFEDLESRVMLHAGSPDPTFGTGGIVEPTLPEADVQIIARQADGKLLVGGSVSTKIGALNSELYLARYSSSGHLDTGFGSSGRVYTQLNTGEVESPSSIAFTSDGKILVLVQRLKSSGNTVQPSELLRYLANGKLDASFGNKGVLTIPAPSGAPVVNWRRVAVVSSGEILLAGETGLEGDTADFALMRLQSDGTVDSGFGTSANHHVVTTSFGGYDHAAALLVQSDGKIVLAGSAQPTNSFTDDSFIIARFTSSGSLDTSFAGGGKETLAAGTANAATIGADGSIYLAGISSNGTNDDFAVLKLNSSGVVVTSFGNNGLKLVDFAGTQPGYSQDEALAVGIDIAGRIILGGAASFTGSSASTFAAVRINPSGSLDKTYSGDGKATAQVGDLSNSVSAALVDPSGNVIDGATTYDVGAALVRFNTSGSLDSTFGSKGIVLDNPNGKLGQFTAVAVQSDGKILAAGSTPNINGQTDVLLARFNADGSDDKTFGGGDGRVVVDLGGQDSAHALHILSDGRILVVASRFGVSDTTALLRFHSDGTLDTSFDHDGILTKLPILVNDATVLSSGKLFLAGEDGPTGFWSVARLNSSGSTDTSFGKSGVLTHDFFPGDEETDAGTAEVFATQKDGKIVVGGVAQYDEPGRDFALARYNKDGTIDTTFGGGGYTQTGLPGQFGGPIDQLLNSITIGSDGKTLAVGSNANAPAIARFTSSGKLDPTFGTGGAITFADDFNGAFTSVALQSDGIIVVAGDGEPAFGDDSSFLWRLTSAGKLDTSFGNKGIVDELAGGKMSTESVALAIQHDGKIITAGGADHNLLLRRFLAS
jgi:uncharacterized delta-60 repeat protein